MVHSFIKPWLFLNNGVNSHNRKIRRTLSWLAMHNITKWAAQRKHTRMRLIGSCPNGNKIKTIAAFDMCYLVCFFHLVAFSFSFSVCFCFVAFSAKSFLFTADWPPSLICVYRNEARFCCEARDNFPFIWLFAANVRYVERTSDNQFRLVFIRLVTNQMLRFYQT